MEVQAQPGVTVAGLFSVRRMAVGGFWRRQRKPGARSSKEEVLCERARGCCGGDALGDERHGGWEGRGLDGLGVRGCGGLCASFVGFGVLWDDERWGADCYGDLLLMGE